LAERQEAISGSLCGPRGGARQRFSKNGHPEPVEGPLIIPVFIPVPLVRKFYFLERIIRATSLPSRVAAFVRAWRLPKHRRLAVTADPDSTSLSRACSYKGLIPMKHLMLSLAFVSLVSTSSAETPKNKSGDTDALIASVGPLVEKAKNPKDLDGLLETLHGSVQTLAASPSDARSQMKLQQLNSAFQFVTRWQEYLAASVAGADARAKASLDNILRSQQIFDPIFLPRSEILEHLNDPDKYALEAATADSKSSNPDSNADPLDNILEAVKKVEDIPDAVDKIGRLSVAKIKSNLDWSQLAALFNQYDNVAAGLPVVLDLKAFMEGPTIGGDVSRIRSLLLLYMLPRAFGTDKTAPPREGETVRAYLDRMRDSASEKENWPLMQKVISVQMRLSGVSSPTPIYFPQYVRPLQSYNGTQCFLAGLSRESSGQYELAVKSYEDAFSRPDMFLPVKAVGARLAAIKAAHPDEYEKGEEDSLIPALSTLLPGGPGAFLSGFASMIQPGMPGYVPPDGIVSILPIDDDLKVSGRSDANSTSPNANAPGH
jgi:hypothetical protein